MASRRDPSSLVVAAWTGLCLLGASACGSSERTAPVSAGASTTSAEPGGSSASEAPPDGAADVSEGQGALEPSGTPAGEGVGNVSRAPEVEAPEASAPSVPEGSTEVARSAGCGRPAGLVSGRASIDVNGETREYILALPENYDPEQPYRLIFGWHPWGGSAQQIAARGYFGLQQASEGQAILVAPEGRDFRGNGLGWGNEGGSDLAFMDAMLERFGSELCLDENRIFATGFSFGAMFSFTLACEQDSMIRAIAPQAGNAMVAGCENGDRSVATMAFIGTDDSLIDGHRQAVQTFVGRNGCSTEPVPLAPSWCDGLTAMFEPCTCVEYPNCSDGYPVIECEYNAGHQFAPTSGQTIWDFFSQF